MSANNYDRRIVIENRSSRVCAYVFYLFVYFARVVFISDRNNIVAEETLNVALNYIRRNPRVGLMIDGIYSVKIDGDDASAILETRMTTIL